MNTTPISKAYLVSALLAVLMSAAAAEQSTPASDWPMFRGGPALLGVASGSLRDKLNLLWKFKTGAPVKSSPAIVKDRVFIGSNDGNVYALDLANGAKVWAFKTGAAVESSPLVLENKVFIGSADSALYALDATSGKLAWTNKYETGDKILGAPNWVKSDGKTQVLVGSYDFKLHCVEADTGKSLWTFESGNYINGSPALADGQAVFGGCDGLLHLISLSDGKQNKDPVEAGAYVAGSVAVA